MAEILISTHFAYDDPRWEWERGEMLHRLYARFPEYAERQFRAEQATKIDWEWDENGIYFLPQDGEDQEQDVEE